MVYPEIKTVDSFKDDKGNKWELLEHVDRHAVKRYYLSFNGNKESMQTSRKVWNKLKDSLI